MTLADFYENTTNKFDITITSNVTNPDIRLDTVTLTKYSRSNRLCVNDGVHVLLKWDPYNH